MTLLPGLGGLPWPPRWRFSWRSYLLATVSRKALLRPGR